MYHARVRWLIITLVVAACSKSNDHCAADVADLSSFIASLPGTVSWGEASKRISPGATIKPAMQ